MFSKYALEDSHQDLLDIWFIKPGDQKLPTLPSVFILVFLAEALVI